MLGSETEAPGRAAEHEAHPIGVGAFGVAPIGVGSGVRRQRIGARRSLTWSPSQPPNALIISRASRWWPPSGPTLRRWSKRAQRCRKRTPTPSRRRTIPSSRSIRSGWRARLPRPARHLVFELLSDVRSRRAAEGAQRLRRTGDLQCGAGVAAGWSPRLPRHQHLPRAPGIGWPGELALRRCRHCRDRRATHVDSAHMACNNGSALLPSPRSPPPPSNTRAPGAKRRSRSASPVHCMTLIVDGRGAASRPGSATWTLSRPDFAHSPAIGFDFAPGRPIGPGPATSDARVFRDGQPAASADGETREDRAPPQRRRAGPASVAGLRAKRGCVGQHRSTRRPVAFFGIVPFFHDPGCDGRGLLQAAAGPRRGASRSQIEVRIVARRPQA